MYERFTDRARHAMAHAAQEAQRFNHEYVGTEHILLGLVKVGSGVAAEVLRSFGVDLRNARTEVERVVAPGPDIVMMHPLPHTPNAKKSIEFAIEEARSFHHQYVGTEHLLLGLLRSQDSVPLNVLRNLGIVPESVQSEVIRLLQSGRDHATASETAFFHDGFTDHARKIMWMASEEAIFSGRKNTDVAHVLLSLLKEKSDAATHALKNLNVDLRELRTEAEKLANPIATMNAKNRQFYRVASFLKKLASVVKNNSRRKHLPLTKHAHSVVSHAIEEASHRQHNTIGTEHLLLGILREETSPAAQLLEEHGVTLQRTREFVRELLSFDHS